MLVRLVEVGRGSCRRVCGFLVAGGFLVLILGRLFCSRVACIEGDDKV